MKAAWYERQGEARDVLVVGKIEDPQPGPGEVRIQIKASGINPGDVKKRLDTFGVGMLLPRVIPHSDGAGVIDAIGEDVLAEWIGRRVWCFGAQTYRPFGTAAEYTVIPVKQAVPLPEGASFEAGACLGIPGITAHRAVHVAGSITGKTVLIQGGAGAVGSFAVRLARFAGAEKVIATCRSEEQRQVALRAGAHNVLLTGDDLVGRIRTLAPAGVDHIVEVAFDANVALDVEVLSQGGSISTYATGNPTPTLPVWLLVFANARLFFVGSDDVPLDAKHEATREINRALAAGWSGPEVAETFLLDEIASAHEAVEHPTRLGRVVLTM